MAVVESPEQTEAIYVLLHSLQVLARRRGWSELQVGSHMFFAWKRDDPLARVAPDVYLLGEPLSPHAPATYQTWLPGHAPPLWVAEIVSRAWGKEYRRAPDNHAQIGTLELVLFDPIAAMRRTRNKARAPLILYRRSANGAFRRTYAGPGPAFSDELGCWLVPRIEPDRTLLRLAEDSEGLVPTEVEQLKAEARRAETGRRRAEDELRRAEAERMRAEARIRELEAALKKTKGERND